MENIYIKTNIEIGLFYNTCIDTGYSIREVTQIELSSLLPEQYEIVDPNNPLQADLLLRVENWPPIQ